MLRKTLLMLVAMCSCWTLSAAEITPDAIVPFKQTPTSELKLHIFNPQGHKASDSRPVVVSFFGGGWNGGSPTQFYQQSRYYNTLGMVGIAAEYRVKSRDKTTPFECVMDGKSAIRWVRAHAKELGIDPNRIVASGGSAGGHVASSTSLIEAFDDKNDEALEVSSKPNAMMLFNPVVNTSDEGYGKAAFNGEELTLSPYHHIRPNLPPSIVFHGTQDRTVPFANAVQFVKLMKKNNNDSRLVVAFGEPHSFFNGTLMGATNGNRNMNRSMYECTKFLMDIKFIEKKPIAMFEPIRIACVGDGTTVGTQLTKEQSYPAELQRLLGDDYRVEMFGFDGATVMAGDNAFLGSKSFDELYAYAPEVIIMTLGSNDSKPATWKSAEEFQTQYMALINRLRGNKECKPEIFVCNPLPTFAEGDNAPNTQIIAKQICPMIYKVSQSLKTLRPNTYSPYTGKKEMMVDGVYPNAELAKMLAKDLYTTIGSVETIEAELVLPKKPLNCDTFEGVLNSADYHALHGGLRNSAKKFVESGKGTVAFVGGSITWNPGWRDMVCEHLRKSFPDTEFTFIAAGISSEGTTSASFRLERDVLSQGTIDLLFEEAAVNDTDGGELRTTATTRIRGMEGIVRHARAANPMVDIVIMNFVDPKKVATYNEGGVPKEIADFERVAEYYQIPTINLAKEVTDRMAAGEFTWADDFRNLHPSPFGQRVYARSINTLLDAAYAQSAGAKKMTKYKMPKAIDPLNYSEGHFITIDNATLGEGWSIVEEWRPTNGQSMRDINNLHLNKPALVATDKAGEMTLEFVGSTVGIVALSGADAGRINYSIDGVEYEPCDLMTGNSLSQYLPRYFTLAGDLDHKKSHTLKITLAESANPKSKGNSCKIARFYVNGKGVK